MISAEDALAHILANRPQPRAETVALDAALGRVLAEDVIAQLTLPPRDASAMDGYAVQLSDVREAGSVLTVIGEAPAGQPFAGEIKAGQAVRIFTGGAVPQGADHIIIQENVTRKGEQVITSAAQERERHIRKAGIDFSKGDILLTAGTRLSPLHIALAAAGNHAELSVKRRLKVALIANGDELKAPGSALSKGDVISSNAAAIGALVQSWGGEPLDLGIATDNIESITALIQRASEADIIVPIGGASVGDYDYMRKAFAARGLALIFEKIAVRPGKPTWLGTLGEALVLGLPGNPASAVVCALLFLKVAMSAADSLTLSQAVLSQDVPANGPRETYLRGKTTFTPQGHIEITPFPRQDSSLLTPFAKANVLLQLAPNAGPWQKGDVINYFAL